MLSTTDHGHRFETELRHVHLEFIGGRVRGAGVELEGLPVDPSLDARGSERSLQIALADPAERSDDVANDLDDSALSATASHGGHGCGEAARVDFDSAEQCSHRALPCTLNVATVMSRARDRRCGEYRESNERT